MSSLRVKEWDGVCMGEDLPTTVKTVRIVQASYPDTIWFDLFFTSQEPFVKIKTTTFSPIMYTASESHFNLVLLHYICLTAAVEAVNKGTFDSFCSGQSEINALHKCRPTHWMAVQGWERNQSPSWRAWLRGHYIPSLAASAYLFSHTVTKSRDCHLSVNNSRHVLRIYLHS